MNGYETSSEQSPATSSSLGVVWAIMGNTVGDVFLAENGAFRVRKVSGITGFISTIAGIVL